MFQSYKITFADLYRVGSIMRNPCEKMRPEIKYAIWLELRFEFDMERIFSYVKRNPINKTFWSYILKYIYIWNEFSNIKRIFNSFHGVKHFFTSYSTSDSILRNFINEASLPSLLHILLVNKSIEIYYRYIQLIEFNQFN